MFLHKTPSILFKLFPSLVWRVPHVDKKIYLTFDDGPIPELTPWVLDTLKDYNARATFFCVGENIEKYPLIFKQVLEAGHSIGNHTFNHLNGWTTDTVSYLENLDKADEVMKPYLDPKLFRPPYGRLKPSQLRGLRGKQVVMWDVLTGDFSDKLSSEQVLRKSIMYTRSGSVVVFHDNIKATAHLKYVLPRYLKYFQEQGYTFESL